jgi:hypothetical protein
MVLPHQRKQTDRMFAGAGIEPKFRKIHGEDADSLALVDRLTGASAPSGVPVAAPKPPRSARNEDRRTGSRKGSHPRAAVRSTEARAGRPQRRDAFQEELDAVARDYEREARQRRQQGGKPKPRRSR